MFFYFNRLNFFNYQSALFFDALKHTILLIISILLIYKLLLILFMYDSSINSIFNRGNYMSVKEIDKLQKKYDELLNEEISLKSKSSLTMFEINCEPSFFKSNKEGTYINGRVQVGRRKIEFTLGAQFAKSYFKDHETVVFILRNGAYCCCAKKCDFDSKNESLQKSFQLKRERILLSEKINELLYPKEYIKLLKVLDNKVLIEYTNLTIETVSFTKAKSIIKDCKQQKITYTYTDIKIANEFLKNRV